MKESTPSASGVSAFYLFPTSDQRNSKGWWHFVCVDMFAVPPASLEMELHCLHTATSASIQPSVFHLCRLKCFHRPDFPLAFWTVRFHVSPLWWWKNSFPYFPMCFPEITKCTSMDNHQLYHLGPIGPYWGCREDGRHSAQHSMFHLWWLLLIHPQKSGETFCYLYQVKPPSTQAMTSRCTTSQHSHQQWQEQMCVLDLLESSSKEVYKPWK